MTSVSILGAGSHGVDVATVAEAAGHTVTEIFDDYKPGHRTCEDHLGCSPPAPYLIGVNSPDSRAELDRPKFQSPTAVHPVAHVGPRCAIGPGVVVAAGAVLSNDVELGRHTHIGAGSTLIRCVIGQWVTVGPGVHVGGDVTVGDGAFIGIGARIKNLVNVGKWATIGAGAVVLEDVPDGVTVVGCPARPIGVAV